MTNPLCGLLCHCDMWCNGTEVSLSPHAVWLCVSLPRDLARFAAKLTLDTSNVAVFEENVFLPTTLSEKSGDSNTWMRTVSFWPTRTVRIVQGVINTNYTSDTVEDERVNAYSIILAHTRLLSSDTQ